jgi:hypothetical protein
VVLGRSEMIGGREWPTVVLMRGVWRGSGEKRSKGERGADKGLP